MTNVLCDDSQHILLILSWQECFYCRYIARGRLIWCILLLYCYAIFEECNRRQEKKLHRGKQYRNKYMGILCLLMHHGDVFITSLWWNCISHYPYYTLPANTAYHANSVAFIGAILPSQLTMRKRAITPYHHIRGVSRCWTKHEKLEYFVTMKKRRQMQQQRIIFSSLLRETK